MVGDVDGAISLWDRRYAAEPVLAEKLHEGAGTAILRICCFQN